MPALIVYDETIKPNCEGLIPSVRINWGPRGITTMKSTMLVNWTDDSVSKSTASRRRTIESAFLSQASASGKSSSLSRRSFMDRSLPCLGAVLEGDRRSEEPSFARRNQPIRNRVNRQHGSLYL